MSSRMISYTTVCIGFLFSFSVAAEFSLCTLERFEEGLESKHILETKVCPVPCEDDVKMEEQQVSADCSMTHQSTTTEIHVAYESSTEDKVVVFLNNMDAEKPVRWKTEVYVNGEPKNLVNVGLEKISVHCNK